MIYLFLAGYFSVNNGLASGHHFLYIPVTSGVRYRRETCAYRRKEVPLLADDGTAAQEARDHDQAAGEQEDIRRHGECTGGQKTQIISFINQSPDPHPHHNPSTHLQYEK